MFVNGSTGDALRKRARATLQSEGESQQNLQRSA
jgi:hypothetical protein